MTSLIVAISEGAYASAPAAFGILRQVAPEPVFYAAAALVQLAAVAASMAGRGERRARQA